MAVPHASMEAPDKEIQIPEWENNALGKESGSDGTKPKRSVGTTLSARLDSVLPAHKRYLGLRRTTFLWVLLAVFLALLALIIGLAVGLSQHKGASKDVPLPSKSDSFVGDLTYYQPGLGACGYTNTAADSIVAVSEDLFDAAGSSSSAGGNSNQNPLCGLMIRAARYDEEAGARRSVDLKVVDRCTGCAADDIDTSLQAFESLAPSASGRVDVTWAWLQPTAT